MFMQYYPFNSRDILYRNKIGAAAAGETLQLRLLLHRDENCQDAFLHCRRDDLEKAQSVKLTLKENFEEYNVYQCEITLDTGLYWYYFSFKSDKGEFFVTRGEHCIGKISNEVDSCWQQTVYSADYSTPEWLKGGIIYQIFPDRFYNSGKEKYKVPDDRFLCSNWSRQPEYRQIKGEKCVLGNDYYGGDLNGITEKLPYIASLGVNCIYLNPIFEAHSNHRYNTADYMKIDPLLGNEEDLKTLCFKAKEYGIRIILDGVFSHTGDDSVYFNRCNRYDSVGAANDKSSPYYEWFKFKDYPDDYEAWWGILTLPETQEENESFCEFITGKNGVLRKWLRCGVSGWRLDVADELPDSFLEKIRLAIKEENKEFYLLGEVWEDASNKISYGERRKFLLGSQLDSVMNYPFAGEIINFARGGNAENLNECICSVMENYPLCSVSVLMNHIGTHDTVRALTVLQNGYPDGKDREWQSKQVLSKEEYESAVEKLLLAAVLQYTLPGVPSVFYGDEAGVQGYGDPFCRASYPWGQEDKRIIEFYKQLGEIRRGSECLKSGGYCSYVLDGSFIVFERFCESDRLLVAVNASNEEKTYSMPSVYKNAKAYFGNVSANEIKVSPQSFVILKV